MVVEYLELGDLAVFDGFKFRRDKETGYYLSSKKINGKRKRLHVYMWEYFKGDIPEGLNIHHKDGDKSNNTIENFELMTNSKHSEHHSNELVKSNYDKIVSNLKEKALPKAIEWHKSEEGIKWHKENYEKSKFDFHILRQYKCIVCGKSFESTQMKSKYCSNKCKSQFRRDSGVDDVVKICEKCNKEYIANKYQKTKYCSLCKSKKC